MLPILRYALSVSRWNTVALLTIVAVSAISGTVFMVLVGQVVGATADLAMGKPLDRFAVLVGGMILVFLLTGLLPVVHGAAASSLELRIDRDVALRRVEPMLAPGQISHLDDPTVQDMFADSGEESATSIGLGPSHAAVMLEAIIVSLSSAVMIGAMLNWWIPVLLIASTCFATKHFSGVIDAEDDAWRERTRGQRLASYYFDLALLEAPKEIRIFGLAAWLTDRYRHARAVAMEEVWRRRWRGVARTFLTLLPHVILYVGAILYALNEAYRETLPVSSAVAVIPAIATLALARDPWTFGQARKAHKSLRSLSLLPSVIAERHPADGAAGSADLSASPVDSIRFEKVSFCYPGSDRYVLRDLDLEIPSGESLAIVGTNGAGKSTFVKLLMGCYKPTHGRVTIDGTDLSDLDEESLARWQRRIAPITQDFIRLPLTLRTNVALAGTRDVARVASEAGIVEMADGLPLGWETVLDKAFPGGTDLSGGQWQRVALARGLYAVESGAGALVLDEPAAALDVRAEAALVDRYLSLTNGVTSIIISHRFSVVRDARRIVVLSGGQVAESGTHDQLLNLGGAYARMFQMQSRRYVSASDA